jgi:hypothetical protein
MKLTITRKDNPINVESVSADDLPVFKMENSEGIMCLGVKWSGCGKTYDSEESTTPSIKHRPKGGRRI